MFEIGSYILYGKRGVCRVDAIGHRCGCNANKESEKIYYQLSPAFGDGNETIFVPVDTPVPIRRTIDSQTAVSCLQKLPELHPLIFSCSKPIQLTEHYRQITDTYDPEAYLSLMKEIYLKQRQATAHHRKLGMIDQRFLAFTEQIVCSEFAIALQTDPEEIRNQIHEQMKKLS